MAEARKGDVVYCDPPYVPLSLSANFTAYQANGFGQAEQIELAQLAESLARKGIPVIISNHDTVFTHRVYGKAALTQFEVQRFISCKGNKRGKAGELLAVFSPLSIHPPASSFPEFCEAKL
jgi:DNA adenine methylase